MPELTRVMTRTCISNISWSRTFEGSLGIDHLVTYNAGEGYACTCEGFRYRKKCKHVNESHDLRCGWGEDAYANVIHEEDICPLCGEETVPFYVGV